MLFYYYILNIVLQYYILQYYKIIYYNITQ